MSLLRLIIKKIMFDKVVFFFFLVCFLKWIFKGIIFFFKIIMYDVVFIFFYNFNRVNKMKCYLI